jgi:hypothetical protein
MRNTPSKLLLAALLAAGCGAPRENTAPEPQESEPKSVPAATIMPPKDPAAAQAAPVPAPADPRTEAFRALEKEEREAMNAYYTALQAALGGKENPSAEDWQKAQETVKAPDAEAFRLRGQKLLDEDSTDLAALSVIQWMLDRGAEPAARITLFALVEKHHMQRPEMAGMCPRLSHDRRDLLEKLEAGSPHRNVRGQACMAQAESLKSDLENLEYLHTAKPEELEGVKEWLGAEKIAALEKLDVAATQQAIEATYERVMKDYADVVVNKGSKRESTLGKQAGAALYELKNLVVGKPAPEIEGVDLDSVSFKLSDYQGKVVLLDFWGNW